MAYRIEFTRPAQKSFDDLPLSAQRKVALKIDALSINPRPHGCIKLHGDQDWYRLRVGDYRIIYQIEDRVLRVLVLKIGNRREVYR